ncbi:hypothetical protein [Sphingomonas sp.]|uniref:hypothetical protein n=1 Tax=Sphingomonas sp. TaxID=28214 RepID=UPI003D6D7CC5
MQKIIIIFILLSATIGCAHGQYPPMSSSSICDDKPHYDRQLSNVTVILNTDMHGGYVSIPPCPEKGYSVDFSKSDLGDIKNRALVEAISRSAVLPGSPIELVVSGYIRKFNGEEIRDVMMIEKIDSFSLNR